MPIPSGSADQGILPFIGLDDELSALRDEVVRLRTENARLLRLLDLTPQQAPPPGPVQTGVFDGDPGVLKSPAAVASRPSDSGSWTHEMGVPLFDRSGAIGFMHAGCPGSYATLPRGTIHRVRSLGSAAASRS